jgi:hypothetical protein
MYRRGVVMNLTNPIGGGLLPRLPAAVSPTRQRGPVAPQLLVLGTRLHPRATLLVFGAIAVGLGPVRAR